MPASPTAAPQSRTRRASARGPPARCISPICAIPTAISLSGFIAFPPDLSRTGRRAVLCGRPSLASTVFQPVSEPNRATLEYLAAHQRHGAERCARVGLIVVRIEDMRAASGAVHGGADRQADLVDEPGSQER